MNVQLQRSGLLAPATQGGFGGRTDQPLMLKLGWPGLDPVWPSLDIISFDHSGSVTAPGGTDPIGNRFREAARAIGTVKRWTTSNRPKVAVIHFDQPSRGNSGIVTLASKGSMTRLRSSLDQPADAAGTSDLGPSLTEAEHLARKCPGHDVRLTILSDFALTDDDQAAVYERLSQFPGRVHAVVLNAEAPQELQQVGAIITHLRHDDRPGALAHAIHHSLTANRRKARRR